MIPTPDLSHLTATDYEHIYEPAEDTFILLDALEKDVDALRDLKPRICLEIGSGSGCVSAFLSDVLGKRESLYLCTDINNHASLCTARTGIQNNVGLDVVQTSFALPLSRRLFHSVDVLIFNPPYVPTPDEEAIAAQSQGGTGDTIAGSWAGGEDGMEVTNIFLDQVETLLSPAGYFYLVAVARNNIPRIREQMQMHHGLRSEIVLQRRAGREHLHVLRFCRSGKAP